jgi:uncharacterized protein DUF4242
MVNLEDERMFCINLARDIRAVESAHKEVGLPYDSITEITTVSPRDLGLKDSGRCSDELSRVGEVVTSLRPE